MSNLELDTVTRDPLRSRGRDREEVRRGVGRDAAMASECLELVRVRGGQKGPSHGPSVGEPSCVTLMLGLIASNFERINSHCFKSLNLWSVCWVSHRKTSQVGTVDKDCNCDRSQRTTRTITTPIVQGGRQRL